MYKKRLLSLTLLVLMLSISTFAKNDEEIVSVYQQPDSPLQLSKPAPTWRKSFDNKGQEWNMLNLDFVSQNLSGKKIRAYAIRLFEREFSKDVGALMFSCVPTTDLLYQPNQTRNEYIGELGSADWNVDTSRLRLKLAVDFVEFTDGSTWGQDISESAQNLAGWREGARAAQAYLLKSVERNGIEALPQAFDEIGKLMPPADQSLKWQTGFRHGVNIIKSRIKRMYEKEGESAVRSDLQKTLFLPADS